MSHFDNLTDAADFLIPYMAGNDYFQEFSDADRIMDPDGIYDIEAEIEDAVGDYFHSEKVREAMCLFAEATPAERLEAFEIYAGWTGTDRYDEVIESLKAAV